MIAAASCSNGRSAGSGSRRRWHVRGNGMIKRTQAPKTPSSRPPPRRRRRPVMPMLRRAARWSALLALAGLAYGGFALSRSPDRDALLAEAADRVAGGDRVARPGGRRHRGRGPRDDRRRDDHGGAGGPARHADPRGRSVAGESRARKTALGPIRGDRAAAAADAACAADRAPAARAVAARRQAAADRPAGRGDPGRRS